MRGAGSGVLLLPMGAAEVNGTRLFYELRGQGPTLVFLHGFTLDHRMWAPQVAALSDRFTVLCYDARGFGRSAMPSREPYAHWQDAAALCDHLGLTQVIAVGHSIGAHQLLELSLARPDLVRGLVAVCLSGLASVPFPSHVSEMFGEIRTLAAERGLDAAKARWKKCEWFAPALERPEVAAELERMLADYSCWHWTQQNPAENLSPPAAERLGELGVPALIVSGGRDMEYNSVVADRLLAELPYPHALRLADVGHMASLEAPEAVSAAIAELAERA